MFYNSDFIIDEYYNKKLDGILKLVVPTWLLSVSVFFFFFFVLRFSGFYIFSDIFICTYADIVETCRPE